MSFRDIYLAIAENELNLLVTETLQMTKYKNFDINEMKHEELTYMILKDIVKNKIISPHFTKKQAKNLLKLIDM